MFWSSCHPQGVYTNVVKMYSNKLVLKKLWISNVKFLVQIDSIYNVVIIIIVFDYKLSPF
jgi:hypothetical protein